MGVFAYVDPSILAHYESAKDLSDLKKFLFKKDELERVRELSDLLKPIHDGILRLEKDESYPSEIIPTFLFIRNRLDQFSTPVAVKLKRMLQNRMDSCLQNGRLVCAMLLDPRFAFVESWEQFFDWNYVERRISIYDSTPPPPQVEKSVASSQSFDLDFFLDTSVFLEENTGCDLQVNSMF
uniref:Uncharacterized protein n=1 Tax=Caenorhabditis japonica TaxID=281687 RepID=A0A8R1IV97_CAEJA